jgi:hypothetical protein
MGTAEVLGKNVVIGSMVERAKAAAAAVLAGAAVDEADKLHAACVTRMNATEKKLAEKAEELRTALLGQSGSLLMNPATRAEATTLKAAHDALLMEYLVEIRAEAPLKAQLGAARLAYKAALAAAPLESPLARAMKWDGKEVQAIAENIEMASAKKLGVYGKEVSVESAGPIKLQAEPPLPGLPGKGTVSITSSQVEINVSDKFKVVVSEKGVSIQAGAQTILETNGVTATLALGGSSVTLTKAELSLESVTTNLKGGTINLG